MVERATPMDRAMARSVAPHACLRRRISRIRRIDTLLVGIGSSSSERKGPLRSPAVERSPPQKVADFILEWVADIKSESGAECTSEPLADIARNQHARPRGADPGRAEDPGQGQGNERAGAGEP